MVALRQPADRAGVAAALRDIPRLLHHPVWRPKRPGQGAGQGVLLIPGFGFGDHSLSLTAAWLRSRGYRPAGAHIGINVGCTTELVDRLEHRLEAQAEATGRRVIIVGQSRGGWLGRVLATKRPELVRGLVMLAAPCSTRSAPIRRRSGLCGSSPGSRGLACPAC